MSEQLLIWDFDGTLADTRGAILASAFSALDSLGLPTPDPTTAAARIGLPLALLFTGLAPDADQGTLDDLVAAYRADFDANAAARTTLFPGIGDTLEASRDAGATSAIATSRRRVSLEQLLGHLGIGHHFATTLTDDDVTASKPDPEMVLAVCDAHEVAPATALMIGDTSFDMEMGRRAGTVTCAVTWGNHPRSALATDEPDHLVDDVDALSAVIKAHLR